MKTASPRLLRILFALAVTAATIQGHDHHHDHGHQVSRPATTSDSSPTLGDHDRRSLQEEPEHRSDRTYCGSAKPSNKERMEMNAAYGTWYMNRRRKLLAASTPIAIYLHEVVPKSSSTLELTDTDKQEFLRYANQAMAGTPFSFKIIGTTRWVDSQWYFCGAPPNGVTNLMKYTTRKGGAAALNVWFCDSTLIGQATFPPVVADPETLTVDGIVMMYPSFNAWGKKEVYTAFSHEIGHWMGLLHTFTDSCKSQLSAKAGFEDYPSWIIMDDGVQDTPNHAGPSWNYDGWMSCFNTRSLDTCGSSGKDPVNNLMNYIHEDCMASEGHFTDGQRERMTAEYVTFRQKPDVWLQDKCWTKLKKKCGTNCQCSKSQLRSHINNSCRLSEDPELKALEFDYLFNRYRTKFCARRTLYRRKKEEQV